MKVDNDRLGQLRELGRHESRHMKPQVDRFVFSVIKAQLCDVDTCKEIYANVVLSAAQHVPMDF